MPSMGFGRLVVVVSITILSCALQARADDWVSVVISLPQPTRLQLHHTTAIDNLAFSSGTVSLLQPQEVAAQQPVAILAAFNWQQPAMVINHSISSVSTAVPVSTQSYPPLINYNNYSSGVLSLSNTYSSGSTTIYSGSTYLSGVATVSLADYATFSSGFLSTGKYSLSGGTFSLSGPTTVNPEPAGCLLLGAAGTLAVLRRSRRPIAPPRN